MLIPHGMGNGKINFHILEVAITASSFLCDLGNKDPGSLLIGLYTIASYPKTSIKFPQFFFFFKNCFGYPRSIACLYKFKASATIYTEEKEERRGRVLLRN